jgi:hypothetical protein
MNLQESGLCNIQTISPANVYKDGNNEFITSFVHHVSASVYPNA